MTNEATLPDFYLVKLDETDQWPDEWLEAHSVVEVYGVYLYDATLHTHLCEAAPSYELWHLYKVGVCAEGTPDKIQDLVDFDVSNSSWADFLRYIHVSDIDKIEDDRRFHVTDDIDEGIESYDITTEGGYRELVDALRGCYSENWML